MLLGFNNLYIYNSNQYTTIMRKVFLVALTLAGFLCSCKKEVVTVETTEPVTGAAVPAAEVIAMECYQGIIKNDTITLRIDTKGTDVPSGSLSYKFFEKDRNEGTIKGHMSGDTLFADYTFSSEGQTSEREVVFLKKGNIFIEGYGDVVDDNKGKVTFKDKKKLFFDSKTVLMKIDCK